MTEKEQKKTGLAAAINAFSNWPLLLSAALCAVLLIWLIVLRFAPRKDNTPAAEYHITLTAIGTRTVGEFNQAASLVRDRVDILTAGCPYRMNLLTDRIELYIPKLCFEGLPVQEIVDGYIACAADFKIYDSSGSYDGYHIIDNCVSVRPDDLKSVSIEKAQISGMRMPAGAPEEGGIPLLKVVFDEGFLDRNAELIASLGDNLALEQDLYSGGAGFITVPTTERDTLYLIDQHFSKTLLAITQYNLTHDDYANKLLCSVDPDDLVFWETQTQSKLWGKNQQEASALTGNMVSFKLSYNREETKMGDTPELTLKTRMDMLQAPYAFGRLPVEKAYGSHYQCYLFKTPLSGMSIPIIRLISSNNSFALEGALWEIPLDTSEPGELIWTQEEDGRYTLTLQFRKEASIQALLTLSETVLENDPSIRFRINEDVFFETTITQPIRDGKISFSDFWLSNTGRLGEEEAWVTRLISYAYTDRKKLPSQLAMEYWIQPSDTNKSTETRFGLFDADRETERRILAVHPEAVVSFDNDTVTVRLDLSLDEMFPERAVAIPKKIYHEVQFEHSRYNNLVFILAESKTDRDGDMAAVSFNKSSCLIKNKGGTDWTGQPYEPAINVLCWFSGGQYDYFIDRYRSLVDTDLFYASFGSHLAFFNSYYT